MKRYAVFRIGLGQTDASRNDYVPAVPAFRPPPPSPRAAHRMSTTVTLEAAIAAEPTRTRARTTLYKLVALAALVMLVAVIRRPDQYLHPYVWVEDGTVNFLEYLRYGWWTVAHPISGYLVLPSKFLHAVAVSISFRWFPEISYWLALLFTWAVLAAVALSPTQLRYRFLCAVGVLLIPTDAEVFAVSLYTCWWGALLALLPLLWKTDGTNTNGHLFARVAMVLLGGFSSPLIAGLAPLYVVRAAVIRNPREWIVTAVAVIVAGVQFYTNYNYGVPLGPSLAAFDPSPLIVIEKFFGYFLLWAPKLVEPRVSLVFGLILVAGLAGLSFVFRKRLGFVYFLLGAAMVTCILMSITRVPASVMHPVLAGPRYFFYPYILLTWLVIQLLALDHRILRICGIVVLAIAWRNGLENAQRRHDAINWRTQVDACVAVPGMGMHEFPVHYIGTLDNLWKVNLPGDHCRQLVRESLFDDELRATP
jgi:hypothetical protein